SPYMVDAKRGPALRPALLLLRFSSRLWRELADPCRPVAERSPCSRPVGRTGARAEQVVACTTREERAAPGRVVTRVSDVLTRDPDRVPDHCGRAVVTPAGPWRVADLRLVAREAVVLHGSFATRNDVPGTDACVRIDRRVRRARVHSVTRGGERDDPTTARRDADRRVGEVLPGRTEVAVQHDLACVRVHDVPREAGPLRAAVRVDRRIEGAPDLAVRVHALLHPGVIRVRPRDALVMSRFASEQEP